MNGFKSSIYRSAWSGVAIVLMVFLGILAMKTVKEINQVGYEPRGRDTITISGEGKVSAKPTLAQISLGLYTEGADVPAIQDQNSRKTNAIIQGLKEMGLSEADMQTSNYSIQPRYDYTDGRQSIIGYSVSQNLSIKVRDLSKVGAVIAKAGELGSNQVNGVTFTIDEPSALQQAARAEAIQDARKKAMELANAMGVSLVKVVTFSESSGGNVPPMPFYRDAAVAQNAVTAPDIQPGELDVTANVSVTFEVR